MNSLTRRALCIAATLLISTSSLAQLSIRDDLNRPLLLKKPATRIVTLAPFLTETLFAVGAGDLAVGVDANSDYPPQAFSVPKVPTGAAFSLERIAALKPDLVLAWSDGIRREDIERISGFGATVFVATARQLEDVPRLLRAVGLLTGHDATKAISDFETRIERLRKDNAYKAKLTTFLEIWNRPLTTVSGAHFLTEALEICRAENVFSDLKGIAPKVSMAEVAEKNPYVIVGAGSAASLGEFHANWQKRQSLDAVKAQRLVFVDDESISRPTPRTPEGIAKLCAQFDEVRAGRVQVQAVAAPARAAKGAPGMALKPSALGAFAPSVSMPVAPVAPAPGPGPMVPPAAAPAATLPSQVTVPAAPARDPGPATEPPPKRPSQYGM